MEKCFFEEYLISWKKIKISIRETSASLTCSTDSMKRKNRRYSGDFCKLWLQQSLLLPPRHHSDMKSCGMWHVSFALVRHVWCNRGRLLSPAQNLHDHLKSPQDPDVVVVLSSLRLSSGYCMPFHLAACCSRTVNSLIAGWKTHCSISSNPKTSKFTKSERVEHVSAVRLVDARCHNLNNLSHIHT